VVGKTPRWGCCSCLKLLQRFSVLLGQSRCNWPSRIRLVGSVGRLWRGLSLESHATAAVWEDKLMWNLIVGLNFV